MFKKLINGIRSLFGKKKTVVVAPTVPTPAPAPAPSPVESNEPAAPPALNPKYPNWVKLWKSCHVDHARITEIANVCAKILESKRRYVAVALKTGVPWKLIAALHYRESSLRFNTVLHNGETLASVHKSGTKLVPKGRGKGKNWAWEDAAVDALLLKKSIFPTEWTIANQLAFAERFNGLGYRNTGEYSPYVWAGTNHHDETGKYVADGKFSKTARESQLGVAAILKGLGESND